jgi:hypothetical protein
MTAKSRSKRKDERPADLMFWLGDGIVASYHARIAASAEVSIGRTNSKRALGFVVTRGDTSMDFVLDRDQVAELASYLQYAVPNLLKPLGRKQNQISFATLLGAGAKKRKAARRS